MRFHHGTIAPSTPEALPVTAHPPALSPVSKAWPNLVSAFVMHAAYPSLPLFVALA
jgi:hypothetical protein